MQAPLQSIVRKRPRPADSDASHGFVQCRNRTSSEWGRELLVLGVFSQLLLAFWPTLQLHGSGRASRQHRLCTSAVRVPSGVPCMASFGGTRPTGASSRNDASRGTMHSWKASGGAATKLTSAVSGQVTGEPKASSVPKFERPHRLIGFQTYSRRSSAKRVPSVRPCARLRPCVIDIAV